MQEENEEIFEDLDGKIDDDKEIEVEEIEPRHPMIAEEEDDVEIEIIDDPVEEEEEEKPKRKENYSNKVKKRIDRERKQTQKARMEAAETERQLNEARNEIDRLRRSSIDGELEGLDTKIERTKKTLHEAIEGGQTADQVEIQNDLAELHARKSQAESNKQNYRETPRQESRKTGDKASEWIFNQSSWYNKNQEATKLANAIDSSLTSEGYDQNTDEYFDELNRRIGRRFPDLISDDLDFDEDEPPKKRSKPVSADVRQTPAASIKKRSSKITLTRSDLINMRKFGLDTKDPKVLKEYAANKLNASGELQ